MFSRGFLLGAAEWLAMIPIGGGVAIEMAAACMLGFAVSYFIGREMKPEAVRPTRTCLECAELIQAAARKCKHCGAVISQEA
ncbi:hypothetical protein NKDENANG_01239 [Candidatus Entotheonellaceae bacterium PAL068K]